MLLMLPIVVAFLAFTVWMLVTALRSGVYSLRTGQDTPGSTSPVGSVVVARSEQPQTFWALAAFNVAFILLVAYFTYQTAELTYQWWLAGEW